MLSSVQVLLTSRGNASCRIQFREVQQTCEEVRLAVRAQHSLVSGAARVVERHTHQTTETSSTLRRRLRRWCGRCDWRESRAIQVTPGVCTPVANQELVITDANCRTSLVGVDPRQQYLGPRPIKVGGPSRLATPEAEAIAVAAAVVFVPPGPSAPAGSSLRLLV